MTRRSTPARLDIRELMVPDTVARAQRFTVEIRVTDPMGIESVELRFGAERRVIPAKGERVASLSVTITPTQTGVLLLEVVGQAVDGARGAPARTVVVVDERAQVGGPTLDAATLERRIAEWDGRGFQENEPYARGSSYAEASIDAPLDTVEDWWVKWQKMGGGQPFDWTEHCDGATSITPTGEVLRCWLAQNPLVAVSMIWDRILPDGQGHGVPYPFWSESMKQDLDQTFYYAYTWLASGLQTPFPIPPDPSINMVPPTFWGSNVALNAQQAWVLYLATVAHSLALEIGGFVPWSVLNYDLQDLATLFFSSKMFTAEERTYDDFNFTGYWIPHVLHAFPKTSFRFFVDQDIIRSTHHATITRLFEWSGSHLIHYSDYGDDTLGKSPMEVAYMHWQYYGGSPVQRMLAGTIRENTNQVRHWTLGCSGTSHMYVSILRALNIPAYTQQGWGQDGEPHLAGHTAPVFPTIGKALSHGDDVLNWNLFVSTVSPPPPFVSATELFISWNTFVDWFYTNPDHNVGRQSNYEIPLKVLPDDVLDLYCNDLDQALPPAQSSVYARFSQHYTVSELTNLALWTRLAQKEAALSYCD